MQLAVLTTVTTSDVSHIHEEGSRKACLGLCTNCGACKSRAPVQCCDEENDTSLQIVSSDALQD